MAKALASSLRCALCFLSLKTELEPYFLHEVEGSSRLHRIKGNTKKKNVFKYIKVWKPNRESVRTLHYPLQKVPLGQTERVKLTEYLIGVFSH